MDMASAKTTDMLDESRQNDPEDQDRILRRSEREQPEKNQKARRIDRFSKETRVKGVVVHATQQKTCPVDAGSFNCRFVRIPGCWVLSGQLL